MTHTEALADAVAFAVLLPARLTAHAVGDHWLQTPRQAVQKGRRDWVGRRACAGHVASYVALQLLVTVVLIHRFDLNVTWLGVVAGLVVTAVTHYWLDRRFTLARLARLIGKEVFHALGTPRPGRDDNPTLGTGAYALDQSWHVGWLLVATLVTVSV